LLIGDFSLIYPVVDLLSYGVNNIYLYNNAELRHFRSDVYTNIFVDCVNISRPAAVLVGAGFVGRSLAPRAATRLRTGLTADCTGLELRENTDLVQTRPAFGGNIMARILTTNHRPQFATVREKVMDMPEKTNMLGTLVNCNVTEEMLKSGITLSNIREKPVLEGIEHAEVLVVAGKAIKNERDMLMLTEFANSLGGKVAATRPVVESGLAHHTQQIGLSGRSVRPKLIITCGVSGAVQFIAGMKAAEYIFAINKNPEAPIMKIANYAVVGDLFEILPKLTEKILTKETQHV